MAATLDAGLKETQRVARGLQQAVAAGRVGQHAHALHEATLLGGGKMVALMGGVTVLAGMRASVAITATQLGLPLKNSLTALNVDSAMELLSKALRAEGG